MNELPERLPVGGGHASVAPLDGLPMGVAGAVREFLDRHCYKSTRFGPTWICLDRQ